MVEVVNEVEFTPSGDTGFAEILLELLHMFKPGGLLVDFSEKASSITLSRVSCSIEMCGTTVFLACGIVSLSERLLLVCLESFLSRKRFLGGFGASCCLIFVKLFL